jgi:DNA-binding response OmpR family regulator
VKRRILLVDDEVAVLLTMKAVLEISGFEVDTAASAKEGKSDLRKHEYQMVITDMRMESDEAGQEVIQAARNAPYQPAIALLTAFPVDDGDWQELGADELLLKPMHTRVLLEQIEQMFAARDRRLAAGSARNGASQQEAQPAAKSSKAANAIGKPAKKAALKVRAVASSSAAKPAKPSTKAPARKAAMSIKGPAKKRSTK